MDVFVSGVGVVSAIGFNVADNMQSLAAGKPGLRKPQNFATTLNVPVGEIGLTNQQLKQLLGSPQQQTISRTALLALPAVVEAITDAQLTNLNNVAFISATSVGGMDLTETFYNDFKDNHNCGRLRMVAQHDCGASTEFVANKLGFGGMVTTISTACSSGGNSIATGARLIKHGLADTVVVGGVDPLCRFTMNGFNSLKILDSEPCRPFDATRAGLNLGEGAGFLVLQSEKALHRAPYCKVSGYANANDAFHQTGSSAEGTGSFLSMSGAMQMAGIDASQISYINTHGTGTGGNDLSEGTAIRRIFGDNVPAFSSVKPFIGHTLGASEGIEAVYSVMSIAKGAIYPNLNFATPMPETNLVPQTKYAHGLAIKHVLSNAFGFGGNDSSVLFSAIE